MLGISLILFAINLIDLSQLGDTDINPLIVHANHFEWLSLLKSLVFSLIVCQYRELLLFSSTTFTSFSICSYYPNSDS